MVPPKVDICLGSWSPARQNGPIRKYLASASRTVCPIERQQRCRVGPFQSQPFAGAYSAAQRDLPRPELAELLFSWQQQQRLLGVQWTVRPMRPQEVRTVAMLLAEVFHSPAAIKPLDGLLYFLFKAEVLDSLLVKLRYNPADLFAILVAEQGGTILGVVEVSVQREAGVLSRMPDSNSYAYISSMAVEQRVRGRGVGSALLSAAEAVAEGWGEGPLALHVYSDNAAAQRLYGGRGYRWVWTERRFGQFILGPEAPSRILMRKDTKASRQDLEVPVGPGLGESGT